MQTTQLQTETPAPTLSDFLTPEKLQEKYPDKLTLPQITWILRNRDRNGLAKSRAVVLLSRKFYISEPLFSAWFASQKA